MYKSLWDAASLWASLKDSDFVQFKKSSSEFHSLCETYREKSLLVSPLIKLNFLDSAGYFLYYINKIFFKKEVYPSKLKIYIWDKFFTPITFILDKILFYKFGKNILYVIQKSDT